jgi:glutamyl-tRNA synthetase
VPHHRHSTKYKAYPTYDLACPIVDCLEGVSHAMRTIEYQDRNDGYHWVLKKLGLRDVIIYGYSRLNLVSTILSKRSLKWFVEEGIAEGWNDPRFPTVQGIMRRGMTVPALAQFMLEQGPSKNTNLMEWDKIWAINKQVIDPISARYTCINEESAVMITLDNFEKGDAFEFKTAPLNKQNESLGTKTVQYGKKIYIELGDAKDIKVGDKITLMNWGNALITKFDWAGGEPGKGKLTANATLALDDTNYKGTKKVTWLVVDPATNFKVTLVELDHLITAKKVDEGLKVQDVVNKNSYITYTAIAEGSVRNLPVGTKIQFERRGFFFVDKIEVGN